jgi:ATP synthase I chain
MDQIQNNVGQGAPTENRDAVLEARIFRNMIVAMAIGVVASLPLGNWRVTTGLLLGGVLSLLNHRWLSNSTTAAFSVLANGDQPRMKLAQYVLRYAVIGISVFAAYKLNLVSITATIAGLCTFVVALFIEALREMYLAIFHREETI